MRYQHKLDVTGQCVERGDSAELRCCSILQKMGREVRMANEEEQKHHIDLVVCKNGVNTTIDVKAKKKLERDDKTLSNKYVWLELFSQNMPGWLIGKEDFVAFELDSERFYVVEREKLLCYFIKKTLPNAEIVDSPQNAYHKWYKRQRPFGVCDIITTITYDELFSLGGYEIHN